MTNSSLELYIAARSWNHSSWRGNFYPEDLPDDWRLSYYSNEFHAIVVPESEWVDIDLVEIERWIDDTNEEFLFFLEVENSLADWQQITDRISCMGYQLGGLLLRPTEVDTDLSILTSSLVSAKKLAPVSLLLPVNVELSSSGKDLLREHKIECGWNVGRGDPGWAHSRLDSELAIAYVTGNKTFTAREWREIIEVCLQYGDIEHNANVRRMLLVIDNEEPQINDLRTATMIGEMLNMPVV